MREDNGIINIIDSHGLKTKYKIINCVELKNKKDIYLFYSSDNEPNDGITVFVSKVEKIEKNKYKLVKISSEYIMNELKILLKQITTNSIDNEKFELKCINNNQKFIQEGGRSLILTKSIYDKIKKDYNSNKNKREKVAVYEYVKEYIIEEIKDADKDFENQFKTDKKYIKAIRNI